ncbi:hypothetical protein VHEMI00896 [[Torrubiella] hemipterigena]|uniref:60S ribosomal protein L20 n=1 Tax=[Torrubiella] hemipterigena TaxID=1531966 RepID=A0A0A1T399_9HYPO|nr:hypothetical protein VHEMI00896 [[Torrubiella] hemipterigena]
MEARLLTRPVVQLLAPTRQTTSLSPLITTRGHKTTARTKRSLKIAPHSSFMPDRSTAFPAATSIVYNPPASEASPDHTPFIFLPQNDPRRPAIERMRLKAKSTDSHIPGVSETRVLPPSALAKNRGNAPSYHLTQADVQEMRKLREEDPLTWSINALARRFKCSDNFVRIAAPASASHRAWLQGKSERQQERWGPMKTEARRQRRQRQDMLLRGEI